MLEKEGFEIMAESALGYSVAGPPVAFEEITGGRVETVEVLQHAQRERLRYMTFVDVVGNDQPAPLGVASAKSKAARIDGIIIERPRIYTSMFPSAIPPMSSRFHLRLPGDLSIGLSAAQAHRLGFQGEGVEIVMPDTGQYRHPYYLAHGYNLKTAITMVPGTDRSQDPVGHGTGECANIFAVAPACSVQPLRCAKDSGALVAALSGFLKAKELKPKVITCSWGGDGPYPPTGGPDPQEKAFALEIQNAIEEGIVVVFSAGNGQFSIEPQVPGVLAAGGVFMSQTMELQASNYASGYQSPWFPDVIVPTVCGLVGMLPRAQVPDASRPSGQSAGRRGEPGCPSRRPRGRWHSVQRWLGPVLRDLRRSPSTGRGCRPHPRRQARIEAGSGHRGPHEDRP